MQADDKRRTTTAMLRETIDAVVGDDITLDALLVPLRARAFGVLLVVIALPNFLPLPAGGILGAFTFLLGLQMLCGLQHPLVPRRLRRKSLRRKRVERFLARSAGVMNWLERWCKPRLVVVMHRPWSLISGLALVVFGLLLMLPIPFTNYPFGVILLAFAFALIERDGVLLIVMWGLAAALAVLAFVFSTELAGVIEHVLHLVGI